MYWVVFDYGEVLSRKTAALPALAQQLGVSAAEFEPAYWAEREAYDRGCPDARYWRAVGDRLGVAVDEETVVALTKADGEGWLVFEPEAEALLDELHQSGVPLALLSNAPAAFGRAVEQRDWSAKFRTLVFSGDLECAKPDPEIWAELVRRLDAQPEQCVFFDDRQVNIDGALAAGLDARLWAGAADARAYLAGKLSGSGGSAS
ncbi:MULTISPECIES: HAD family phosphatase [unclassified Crossiella]|uniref:HAD family hydrolase n=1 Tax=unclassified Crossiella TaxID=2620835 RepID=UPI001FFF2D0F|nr:MULTISPECIES: HAD family phosphatase [unclassified Crossiella]MCK2236482.1 HAD family phosphatase [Crossiella sp. S99.2]MCK2250149.1 HAD family phosphatase [Crossiella sp. S99.1]